MRLDPRAFNAFLAQIGQRFAWRKSNRCPCVNPNSGAAAPGCPNCHGKSWFWESAQDSIAGVASQQIQLRWAQMGLWEDGDMVVSIPENTPMYEMGQMDRVTALNNTDGFSVALVRGSALERLYDSVCSITRAFWLDSTGAVVNASLPEVDGQGSVTWTGEIIPPMGVTYTLTGTRFREFFCWGGYPGDRNQHQGARLPRRVVLRRFDLFGRDL